jgi:hypothetical protein
MPDLGAPGANQGRLEVANGGAQPASPLARQVRTVLTILLLIVAVAGVRAVGVGVSKGPWHGQVILLGVLLEVALAALLVTILVIRRRRPVAVYPGDYLRAVLPRLIAIAMAATAALAVLGNIHVHSSPGKLQLPRSRGRPRSPKSFRVSPGTGQPFDLAYLLYGLLGLLVAAAIVACVVAVLRRRPAQQASLAEFEPDDGTSLQAAVESGRAAMRDFDDAQAAIIACYVAMESSLAQAGTARDAAETPDELLARAVASGLLRGSGAARLTALFYEARFSSHPLPTAARDQASQALEEMSADLRRASASAPAGSERG